MRLADVVKCAYDSIEKPVDYRGYETKLLSLQPKWRIREVVEVCVDKYLAKGYDDNCISFHAYALLDGASGAKSRSHPHVWNYIAPHVRQFGFRLWGPNNGEWEGGSFIEKDCLITRVGPGNIERLALDGSDDVPMFGIMPGMMLAEALAKVVEMFNSYDPEDPEIRRLRHIQCCME